MAKTLSFGAMHVTIAFSIGYALTGSLAISGALTLLEPLANTVAYYFFDKSWSRFVDGKQVDVSPDPAHAMVAR